MGRWVGGGGRVSETWWMSERGFVPEGHSFAEANGGDPIPVPSQYGVPLGADLLPSSCNCVNNSYERSSILTRAPSSRAGS